MIETGYFGNIKNYPETDILICVARKYPWFIKRDKMEHNKILAPSPQLLADWKNEKITWEEYTERYKFDMLHYTKPIKEFRYLRHLAKDNVVRFMCWEKNPPCHRFILRDMILGVILS